MNNTLTAACGDGDVSTWFAGVAVVGFMVLMAFIVWMGDR